MCGKFTAMASWSQVVDFSQPLASGSDKLLTLRVMGGLPVILWDHVAGTRRVVPMRWGFPDPKDARRPRPIHARAETIAVMPTFADAFRDGQRGIVLARTFNEAPENGVQHVITPGALPAIGMAFVWRRFADPSFACVMVTVPANPLLVALPTDRMPAILDAGDWARWLGEEPATTQEVLACLKTQAGADWRMEKEQRDKPTVRDPTGIV